MYGNTATGMEKASHERMLNDKGRKIVKERLGGGQMNSYDHFKNMREEEAEHFDSQWGQMAGHLGLQTSTANNRLEYGGGKKTNPQYNYNAASIKYDDDRRGAYVDHHSRGDNVPDNFNRQAQSDIGPTQTIPRAAPIPMGRANQQNIGAPLAVTDGRAIPIR